MQHRLILALVLLAVAAAVPAAEEVKELFDFEDGIAGFEAGGGAAAPEVVAAHATRGAKALRVPCAPNGYIARFVPSDWSGYDELDIDAFVEGTGDVAGTLLIGDEAWATAGRSYWNRHNSSFTLHPGANVITVPTGGLFRGEAGSRANDLKTPIDPARIRRFDLGFAFRDGGKGAVYLDRFRLLRDRAPDGVLAFSFGPEGHALMPGFSPIGWNTVHGKDGAKAGLRHACYHPNRARDDTFPTRLFGNLVELEDGNTVVIDVPPGDYGVWMGLDDPGYWDWECARFTKRVITANGAVVSTEEPAAGLNERLFRFEGVEPTAATDVYATYIEAMYPQRRFTVAAQTGTIAIGIEAGNREAQKLAAMVVWPLSRQAEAEAWLRTVLARNREEFLKRAVCVQPNQPRPTPPASAAADGYWLGMPELEDDVHFGDGPGPQRALARTGARGERLSYSFAVRPTRDLGEVASVTADLVGKAGSIPSSAIDCRYVHHAIHRGFSDLAYTIGPDTLRPVDGASLRLGADATRQFWITVAIPADARPGTYSGAVTVTLSEHRTIAVPWTLEVLDLVLDQPDFLDAYLGFGSPVADPTRTKQARDELFVALRDGGMNSVTDGPGIGFTGFAADGSPELDFTAMDEFVAAARQAGLPLRDVLTYGGLAWPEGVSASYELDGSQEETAKRFGKPYGDVIAAVFAAIDRHAREHDWPTIRYCRCDEPRVLEPAQRVLADMRLFRDRAPMARIGGFYSVDWDRTDPLSAAIRDIFGTLVWSGLNAHHQADIDHARELGRELYIYNQGTSRFSFGAYQWAEMRKGVRGRAQWHLSAISGYQFFDLDGREPDIGYLRWSSHGILPTLAYHRTREGFDDFRWAVTLWNRAERAGAAGADAKTWLQRLADGIPAGAATAAKDWMGDDAFRAECVKRLLALPK